MTAAIIWGVLTALFCLVIIGILVKIETAEPAGRHHKPSHRQRERARDEATVDTFRGFLAEQHMETMPGPLMPLPPEVRQHGDPECDREQDHECPGPGCTYPLSVPAEPEDPHDVASDDEHADQLVGGLFDRSEDHWNDDTLLGLPVVTDA
jgi:hypothetical protein